MNSQYEKEWPVTGSFSPIGFSDINLIQVIFMLFWLKIYLLLSLTYGLHIKEKENNLKKPAFLILSQTYTKELKAFQAVSVMSADGLATPSVWASLDDQGLDTRRYQAISWYGTSHSTHCALVTPYGDRYLCQHWLRYWLVVWRHQAITWTNVDLSSLRSIDIHLRASSFKIPEPSVTEIGLKITNLKFHSNLPGTNELIKSTWLNFGELIYE